METLQPACVCVCECGLRRKWILNFRYKYVWQRCHRIASSISLFMQPTTIQQTLKFKKLLDQSKRYAIQNEYSKGFQILEGVRGLLNISSHQRNIYLWAIKIDEYLDMSLA